MLFRSSTGAAAPASRTHVIIGVDAKSVPLTFWDEKTKLLSGYDADLAREAFKRANLEYEFKSIVWADKEKELVGGYLKKYKFKEACANWWQNMSLQNKEIIKNMPNFDKNVFKEITEIEV